MVFEKMVPGLVVEGKSTEKDLCRHDLLPPHTLLIIGVIMDVGTGGLDWDVGTSRCSPLGGLVECSCWLSSLFYTMSCHHQQLVLFITA
jgi:hypothetical protein